MFSYTSFFLYKFLAPYKTQLYSAHKTCTHTTKIVRFDWSTAFTAGVISYLDISHICCESFESLVQEICVLVKNVTHSCDSRGRLKVRLWVQFATS